MPVTLVNPMNEGIREPKPAAPRLGTMTGKRLVLLDISKPGGSIFLDRLEHALRARYAVEVVREKKPTFAKPAPYDVLERILAAQPDAVIEALAD
jgi:hypothetical protein